MSPLFLSLRLVSVHQSARIVDTTRVLHHLFTISARDYITKCINTMAIGQLWRFSNSNNEKFVKIVRDVHLLSTRLLVLMNFHPAKPFGKRLPLIISFGDNEKIYTIAYNIMHCNGTSFERVQYSPFGVWPVNRAKEEVFDRTNADPVH